MDEVLPAVSRYSWLTAIIASAVLAVCVSACRAPASDASDAPEQRTGYVVDSILPPGEALRRFRAGLDSPATFGSITSRDTLVTRFFAAVRSRNRAALDSLAMSRADFAYLVFPRSRWSKPPYNQPPDIAWMLFRANSESGLSKLLNRADRFHLYSYRCDRPVEHDGALSLWSRCVVRVSDEGQPRDLHLFGTIVEVDGRFKFAGYDNDF